SVLGGVGLFLLGMTVMTDGLKALAGSSLRTVLGKAQLERCAAELSELRCAHRSATVGAVADGKLSTDAAITRVETVRGLEALAYHAWRSSLHLVERADRR